VPGEIHILNASFFPLQSFDGTARMLDKIFDRPVTVTQIVLDLQLAYDNSRQQYHSTVFLSQLLKQKIKPKDKQIAVVDVDLFIPILTYVFGEAQLAGNVAVVSTHRLSNQFYGLPRNNNLTMERLEKEIVHELGHTFGLYHCHQFECVMRSSTYVEEIDLKRAYFCDSCSILLKQLVTTN
jgi:archaemetzincin